MLSENQVLRESFTKERFIHSLSIIQRQSADSASVIRSMMDKIAACEILVAMVNAPLVGREAQVVKLAAEVFEASPDEWNEQPAPLRAGPLEAQPRQRYEEADPEGIDHPQRGRPARE